MGILVEAFGTCNACESYTNYNFGGKREERLIRPLGYKVRLLKIDVINGRETNSGQTSIHLYIGTAGACRCICLGAKRAEAYTAAP